MKLIFTIERSKEVPHFGYVRDIERKLNEELRLKDFGAGLTGGFLFVLRSFKPGSLSNDFFKPIEVYRPRKKEVCISYVIPYYITVRENKLEVSRYVVNGLLESILKLKELGVKNYDVDAFYSEVQKICEDYLHGSSSL
ncbi:MAG: hypothetical protein HOP30_18840 [Cyclobacteriaceae bacterium]|nr:hypothetical protein [Cyclobacteriaceae bacterium]